MRLRGRRLVSTLRHSDVASTVPGLLDGAVQTQSRERWGLLGTFRALRENRSANERAPTGCWAKSPSIGSHLMCGRYLEQPTRRQINRPVGVNVLRIERLHYAVSE